MLLPLIVFHRPCSLCSLDTMFVASTGRSLSHGSLSYLRIANPLLAAPLGLFQCRSIYKGGPGPRRTRTTEDIAGDAESCHMILGLDEAFIYSPADVKTAFIRAVRQLRATKEETAKERLNTIRKDHEGRGVPSQMPYSNEEIFERRIRKLREAYETLVHPDRQRAYQLAVTTPSSVHLGTAAIDGVTEVFDPHHVDFIFSDPISLTKSLQSNQAETRVASSTQSDVNIGFGDDGLGNRHAEYGWSRNNQSKVSPTFNRPGHGQSETGDDIEITLPISFKAGVRGASRALLVKRREQCGQCQGVGKVRSGRTRCTTCKGASVLEIPSGTYLIRRECSVCLGQGFMPAPQCGVCNGSGIQSEVTTKKVTIKIPPGVPNKAQLKIRGEGHAGKCGGERGSLLVTCLLAEHPYFYRPPPLVSMSQHGSPQFTSNGDVHVVVPLSLSAALLGGDVVVPMLDGSIEALKVPPNTPSGYQVCFEGLGAHIYDSDESKQVNNETCEKRGDLLVHLVLTIPHGEALSSRQRNRIIEFDSPGMQPQSSSSNDEPSRFREERTTICSESYHPSNVRGGQNAFDVCRTSPTWDEFVSCKESFSGTLPTNMSIS